MLELVLASRNRHKLAEFASLLQPLGIKVVAVSEFPEVKEVVEDGATFQANAVKKAREVALQLGLPALADDSGLVVDALDGAPGVRSARYAGEDASDAANNEKLLKELEGFPPEQRTAAFHCVIAFAVPDGEKVTVQTAEGICSGIIADSPQGTNGFGYDPIFFLPEYGKTFAQLAPEEKNRISHRGRAMAQLYQLLSSWQKGVSRA